MDSGRYAINPNRSSEYKLGGLASENARGYGHRIGLTTCSRCSQWQKSSVRGWRRRNANDATLIFLCELGPPPYAMTDGDRRELSDRWHEALQIRKWVQDIWRELEDEEGGE